MKIQKDSKSTKDFRGNATSRIKKTACFNLFSVALRRFFVMLLTLANNLVSCFEKFRLSFGMRGEIFEDVDGRGMHIPRRKISLLECLINKLNSLCRKFDVDRKHLVHAF